MSTQQAFHTCCRDGLTTPNLGFQYQAASAGLTREHLAAIARQMVGYVPGPGAPLAPSPAELAAFPVSLRYFQIPGVGPAVSQTVYVGHEDRQTQSGRFGNYFSHVLTDPVDGASALGSAPIRLWQSSAWRTEAGPADATELSAVMPGAITAAAAKVLLGDPARSAWFADIHDWLAEAIDGRSRIVILDDAEHGWAWIAAVTLSLPAALAARISFDTFTGEPDRSAARICVADPAVDRVGLSRHELTGELHVVDLTKAAPEPRGLLARAVAEGRTFQLTTAIDNELSLGELAVLISAKPEPMCLEPSDLPLALTALNHWLEAGEPHPGDLDGLVERIGDAVYEESDLATVERSTLSFLWRRVGLGARAVPDSARQLALRLALVVPDQARDTPLPAVPKGAAPPELVGAAIDLVSREEADPIVQRDHLRLVAQLGLVGANSALDRRIGEAAGACLRADGVVGWLCQLASGPEGHSVVEQVIRSVSTAGKFDEPVMSLLTDDSVGRLHHSIAGGGEDFSVTYARVIAAARTRPAQRRDILMWSLERAETPAEAESLIDVLYGDRTTPHEFQEVLRVLTAVGRQPDPRRLEEGWRMLERADPFSGEPAVRALAGDLNALDSSGGRRSIYLTVWLDGERAKMAPSEWADRVAKYRGRLTDDHLQALLRRQAHRVTERGVSFDDHREIVRSGVERIGGLFVDCYWEAISWALRDVGRTGLAVDVISIWGSDVVSERVSEEALFAFLPKALGAWKEDARALIGDALGRRCGVAWAEWWDSWCEENPAAGVLGRQFAKARTRRPRG